MKNIKKFEIIFIAIATIIITIFTMGIVNASEKDITKVESQEKNAIGNVFSLNYDSIAGKTNTYCIQHHKTLKSPYEEFVVDKYVEIDGKTATVYNSKESKGKEVKSTYNAIAAYIFNQKQGYGTASSPTQGQKALWYYANDWVNALFGSGNDYNWASNDNVSYSNNDVIKRAKEYAENVENATSETDKKELEMTDKTPNKTKLKKIDLGNNYYRIGPFKWEFEGKLESIAVKADGKTVTDYKIIQMNGKTAKTIEVKDIESNKNFYIDIKNAKDITSVHLDLKTTKKITVEKVKVWFFKSAKKYQNIVHAISSETPVNAKGEESQDYKVKQDSVKIGLLKIDDRGKTPLDDVGFKFRAKVQRYEKVGEETHYKKCEHDENKDGKADHPNGDVDWIEYKYNWKTYTMYVDKNNTWNNINEDSAHEFKTGKDGWIPENTVSFNSTYVTNRTKDDEGEYITDKYAENPEKVAIETSNPHYGYEEEIGNEYKINTENLIIKPTNHQKYVKLSGYVWNEGNQEKETSRNSVYDQNVENGINGIKVYLKDSEGNIVKRKIKNKDGTYTYVDQITETKEQGIYDEIKGGEYRFEGVDLDELQAGKYHVEFEYGGVKYQSVKQNLNKTNGSKAIDTNSRNKLDSEFTSVDGNGTNTLHIGNRDVQAIYYGTNKNVNKVNYYKNDEVYARTDEAGYDLYSDFKPTMEEIRYINLGLFEKPQAEYALANDLYNVRIEVNGKSHIYRYSEINKIDTEDSWNIGVKFQKNNGTYKRAIYKADAEYETADKSKELKVYATYIIALNNESPYLSRINNIFDYCDNRMKLIHMGTNINDKDEVSDEMHYEQVSYNNEKYSKYRIDTNTTLKSGEKKFMYAQFEIDREAVLSLINDGEVLNNVAEINSYTTFKNNNTNTPVAVVDKYSVPNNIIPGTIATYEHDTDAATSLKLELKNARGVSGSVFVDATGKEGKEAVAGEERKGNGKFDNGETTIGGILVTLKENSGSGKVYQTRTVDSDGKYGYILEQSDDKLYNYFRPEIYKEENKEKYAYVADNLTKGNFLISNYIPGDYTLTYTWGDSTYKVQYYKGTIYKEDRVNKFDKTNNTFWYRGNDKHEYDDGNYSDDSISIGDRYTDAFDNHDTRQKIDDEMRKVTINTLESKINQAYADKENGKTPEMITEMDSTTPTIEVSVEYPTTITDGTVDQVRFTIQNVDFGIVERAKQALDLRKRITEYKIKLANGQVLVDAEIDENGNLKGIHEHTTYLPPSVTPTGYDIGQLKTEMDNELIEGATLEVTYEMKVTNVGERDYLDENYYYYGIVNNNSKPVTVSVTELLDYVDGKLNIVNQDDPDNKWTETNQEHLKDVNASKQEINDINQYRTYLTEKLTRPLKYGESNTVSLHVSKLLTSTNDNTFDNKSEITQVTKNDGFTLGTPVKLSWTGDKFHFNIGDSEKIIIVPSTGENKNYMIPTIIGITAITILGIGIVLIKKFIIGKK